MHFSPVHVFKKCLALFKFLSLINNRAICVANFLYINTGSVGLFYDNTLCRVSFLYQGYYIAFAMTFLSLCTVRDEMIIS